MAGLFDTFTIAKRGLNVQQSAINTTSHNIANANTVGYSRQRSVVETTKPFGGMSRFDSTGPGQVGTGAQVTSIQRIRDYFIDYQVRNENGKLGNYDVESKFLSEVEGVFGEPSDKGIQKLFGEFYAAFQEVAKTPEKSSARTVAIQKAAAIADALNHTYTQLEKKVTDAQDLLQDNVKNVNSYLDQINELNQQIASVSAVGQTPNDLMDKRDNLLDEVSKMFGITVDRKSKEAIDLKAEGFQKTGNVIDNLVNSSPTNDKYTRFSYVESAEPSYTGAGGTFDGKVILKYYPLGNSDKALETITIDVADEASAKELADSLNQNKILIGNKDGIISDSSGVAITSTTSDEITKKIFKIYEVSKDSSGNVLNSVDPKSIKGEVAGNQSAQNMIKAYMKDLDRIAASLAYSVNAIQTASDGSTSPGIDEKGNPFELFFVNLGATDASGNPIITDSGIGAKTITVNQKLLEDVSKLNCKGQNTDGERNADRAQAIADLITKKINMSKLPDDITSLNRNTFFSNSGISLSDGVKITGSSDGKAIDQHYKDMISRLGTQSQEATRRADNQRDHILKDLENQRLSQSGVSLDEEMANLIQFQHAYQANAKIISTVDELLDVVINGLKR